MSTEIALAPEQIDLITRTVAKGCSKDELALFLHACAKTGLDPLMKQIYAVKRGPSMAIQTGIDGLRLVAERTGRYAPGREPSFRYRDEHDDPLPLGEIGDSLLSATAYIRKMTPDGTWHEVAATALFEEYVQRTQTGQPTAFWHKMPHVMLGKVAEALALRRAFPMELSGIYSADEMSQADSEEQAKEKFPRLRGASAPVAVAEPEAVSGAGEAERAAEGAGSAPVRREAGADVHITPKQMAALRVAIRELAAVRGVSEDVQTQKIMEYVGRHISKESLKELDQEEFTDLMAMIHLGTETAIVRGSATA